jgi:hypothetical protein
LKVCGAGKRVGFDRELGLCKCQVDDLARICDRPCRLTQRETLSYVCSDPMLLRMTYDDGTVVSVFL